MTLYLDSRTGNERREFDLAFPQAGECRLNAERRSPRMAEDKTADENWAISEGYWGACEDDPNGE